MGLLTAMQHLPLGAHYFGGRCLSLVMRAVGYRKKVVYSNLQASFPEKDKKSIRKIARKFYRNLGRVYAEAMWLGGCRGKKQKFYDRKLFTVEGLEEVFKACEKGSVMILDCHTGNWEITGACLQGIADLPGATFSQDNVAVVYRRLHSPRWDRIMARTRCALQTEDFKGYVESRVIMRYALSRRKEKMVYVFLNDQYPYGTSKSRLEVTFMNRKTQAMDGAVLLAAKLGMSVFYMYKDRLPDDTYHIKIKKLCEDASTQNPQELIDTYYSLLEEDIRKNPSNYLWSHKRWK